MYRDLVGFCDELNLSEGSVDIADLADDGFVN